MTDIDTSIYKSTTQPPNLLTQFGQVAGIQNALNQSQLFQTEFADRAALSKAYEGVPFDPSTGAPDMNALTQRFKDAGIQRLLPEALGKAQDLQSKGLSLRNTQVDLATKAIGAQRQVLGTLAAKGGNFTDAEATNAIAEIYPILKQVPGAVDNAISEIVKLKGLKTPEERHEFVQTHLLNTMSAQERVNAIYGAPTMIDTGGQIQPTAVSAFTGKATPIGGPFTKTLSPGEATAPTSVLIRNPDGTFTPSTVTRSQYAKMAGQGPVAQAPPLSPLGLTPSENLAPRLVFENGQPGVRTTENVLQQQGYPARPGSRPGENAFGVTLAPPSAPAPSGFVPTAAAPPSSAAASGFVPTGPKIGSEAAANAEGTRSATALADLQDAAASSVPRIFTLHKALDAIENTNTGPGTDARNHIASYIAALPGGIGKPFTLGDKDIATFDEAKKYLTQVASAQAAKFGQGTDSKLATAAAGSPSVNISNLAARDVVKTMIGLERMTQAQAQAFNDSGQPPEAFHKWAAAWSKDNDARAFIADKMTPEQFVKFVDGLDPQEKARFQQSYNYAVSNGFIERGFAKPKGGK